MQSTGQVRDAISHIGSSRRDTGKKVLASEWVSVKMSYVLGEMPQRTLQQCNVSFCGLHRVIKIRNHKIKARVIRERDKSYSVTVLCVKYAYLLSSD